MPALWITACALHIHGHPFAWLPHAALKCTPPCGLSSCVQGMVPTSLMKLPKILGGDVSGVVVEAPPGSKVTAAPTQKDCLPFTWTARHGDALSTACVSMVQRRKHLTSPSAVQARGQGVWLYWTAGRVQEPVWDVCAVCGRQGGSPGCHAARRQLPGCGYDGLAGHGAVYAVAGAAQGSTWGLRRHMAHAQQPVDPLRVDPPLRTPAACFMQTSPHA
jgi:hypothetical protein